MNLILSKPKLLRIYSLLFLTVMALTPAYSKALDIVDQPPAVMKQFLWFFPPMADEKFLVSALNKGDPFQVTESVFRDYYINKDTKRASKSIDAIIKHWNLWTTRKLTYQFPYRDIPAGWWSGMEAMQFPMLLVAVAQRNGNKSYLKLANLMLDNALTQPSNGGVLWRNGSNCWLSEYSWDGMKKADEYFVLNGHLLALEALKLTADALERKDLEDAYQCAVRGTKARANEFITPESPWASYMLHPKTIDQVHYVIFETIQFSNLYTLTKDRFFKEQENLRRKILQKRYPIYKIGTGKASRLFFSMMGAPHPYSVDTYGIQISCGVPNGKRVNFSQTRQFDGKLPLTERVFIDRKMYFNIGEECSVTAKAGGGDFELYRTKRFETIRSLTEPEQLEYKEKASLDAYDAGDQKVVIDPMRSSSETEEYLNTQGRIQYKFNDHKLTDDAFLGIVLVPDKDLAIGVELTDGKMTIFRYWPRLIGGKKNIILLSKLGFTDGNDMETVSGITLFVYTDRQRDVATVRLGRVLYFANQAALKPYFAMSRAYMPIE